MLKKIISLYFISSTLLWAETTVTTADTENKESTKVVKKERKLIKNDSIRVDAKAKVFVPLEVISDIEIKTLVVDDEEITLPFEMELNKRPDTFYKYRFNLSNKEIDIDNDGKIDTVIYVNKNIDNKIIRDNYVKISGKNISKEGTHRKKVYITVEVDNRWKS